MSGNIIVIDYGLGNVFSVCNALREIGQSPVLTRDPKIVACADRVILPGVGSFSKAMSNITDLGIMDSIRDFIQKERPFLGVCVGMQVLLNQSTEYGLHYGMGYIDGDVAPIPGVSSQGKKVKVPHIGWSEVQPASSTSDGWEPLAGSRRDNFFYFVHSFHCRVVEYKYVLGAVNYEGNMLSAVIGKDNILGVQFHPERSGFAGLMFLKRFCQR